MNQLTASLRIPGFGLEALLRHEPQRRSIPCALIAPVSSVDSGRRGQKTGGAALLEVNRTAARAGVRSGMPTVQARALCPELRIFERDPEAEQKLDRQLRKLAGTLAPRVEPVSPGSLLLDLATLPQAQQDPGSWCLAALDALVPLGVPVRLATAAHPELARLATRSSATCARLEFDGPEPLVHPSPAPQPSTPDSLRPLPIRFLDHLLPPDALDLLEQLGIQSLDDFLQLPLHERNERIGPAARHIHEILHHLVPRPVAHEEITEKYRQAIDFEYLVESSEILLFHFKRLIESAIQRLSAHHRHAAALRVELFFEAAPAHRRLLRLPEATLDPGPLLRAVRVHLESLVLPAPVVGIALEAEPGWREERQARFFDPCLPDPHRLSTTLARLESLLGPDSVGIPVRCETHRPDCFRMRPFDPGKPAANGAATPLRGPGVLPPLPLRRFRPAPALVVATGPGSPATTGLPRPAALLSGPRRGRVVRFRGPFLLSGHWWEAEGAWRQAEWDIELESGHLLRLVFLPPESWRLAGVYE